MNSLRVTPSSEDRYTKGRCLVVRLGILADRNAPGPTGVLVVLVLGVSACARAASIFNDAQGKFGAR